MLILTRRIGETIVIGNDVTVTIVNVNGSQVRIGVKAPKEVSVDREEIAERKRAGLQPFTSNKDRRISPRDHRDL